MNIKQMKKAVLKKIYFYELWEKISLKYEIHYTHSLKRKENISNKYVIY